IEAIDQVLAEGGSFGVSRLPAGADTDAPWIVGIQPGRALSQRDMSAAAGYGLGATAGEAITDALADFGIEVDL
ncbi:MAG: hypothetical protein ACRDQH_02405, partial [Pseudonocardiaceae bacterium]